MISQREIMNFRRNASPNRQLEVEDAIRHRRQTAFLSHSHKDAILAKSLQGFFHSKGWFVYIDWEDEDMPPKPNRDTATKIQGKIHRLGWFFYLATHNSALSRWCPWEIGYANGVKDIDSMVIIPTRDNNGQNYGNEYLNLYRHVDATSNGDYGLFEPGGGGVYLRNAML